MSDESGAARSARELTDKELRDAEEQTPDDDWYRPDNPLLLESYRRDYLEYGCPPDEAEREGYAHALRMCDAYRESRDEQQLQQLINEVMMATPIEDIADALRPLAVPHEQGDVEPHDPRKPHE